MTVAHLHTPENQAKAAAARRLSRPRRFGYPAYGKNGVHLAHRFRAEQALGKPLPIGAEVHHADGSKSVTAPLVICQDSAYHHLLHFRAKVLALGGNPDTDKPCSRCKRMLPKSEFNINRKHLVDGLDYFCRRCVSEKNAIQKARRG
jgi:hypothetical protein